jgi:hypothetical protein
MAGHSLGASLGDQEQDSDGIVYQQGFDVGDGKE